ncbi:MAG: hypothetical protein OQK98_02100 [Gammaproteobacteria bacterium]|nr:hypothetical protein [Gammaproteobacteria bacterium]
MIRIIKWLFIICFLLGILLGVLTVSSIDDFAIVEQQEELTSNELKRVKRFIQENKPQELKTGETANTSISQQDLNLALNYISEKAPGSFKGRLSSNVILDEKQAYVQMSFHLPKNPFGKYINITATLQSEKSNQNSGAIKLKSLSLGSLDLPAIIAKPLAEYTHKILKDNIAEYNKLSQSLQSVSFSKQQLTVNYMLDEEAINSIKTQLSSLVISAELKEALIAQTDNLSKISYQLSSRPSLNELIRPMFELAEIRSTENNPVIENKAVFVTLGAYVLNKNISELFEEIDQKPIKVQKIYLIKRHDLSKHLLISAAITSLADSSLAESIGLEKEVDDSNGGSGFSFSDLAADLAGIRLAEYAIKNEEQARLIQKKLAVIKFETDYMPSISHLPEGLNQQQFNKDYLNTASYKTTELMIKQRIDQLVIYR